MDDLKSRRMIAANYLKSLRTETGMSQKEFADELGTTRHIVSDLENAGRTISVRWIEETSKVLGLSEEQKLKFYILVTATKYPDGVVEKLLELQEQKFKGTEDLVEKYGEDRLIKAIELIKSLEG